MKPEDICNVLFHLKDLLQRTDLTNLYFDCNDHQNLYDCSSTFDEMCVQRLRLQGDNPDSAELCVFGLEKIL